MTARGDTQLYTIHVHTYTHSKALLWMFNDSRSFYFSMETDLTKSLQRQLSGDQPHADDTPTWKTVRMTMLPYFAGCLMNIISSGIDHVS